MLISSVAIASDNSTSSNVMLSLERECVTSVELFAFLTSYLYQWANVDKTSNVRNHPVTPLLEKASVVVASAQ